MGGKGSEVSEYIESGSQLLLWLPLGGVLALHKGFYLEDHSGLLLSSPGLSCSLETWKITLGMGGGVDRAKPVFI